MRMWLLIVALSVAQPAIASGLFSPNVDAVKNTLDDPYSAKFEEVERVANGAVCGKVNAKNQYGAYSGRKEFAIVAGTAYIETTPAEVDTIILHCVIAKSCKDDACLQDKQAQMAKDRRANELAKTIGAYRSSTASHCRAHMDISTERMMECSNAVVACRNMPHLADEADCLDDALRRYKQ